jgi:hypothetical protein
MQGASTELPSQMAPRSAKNEGNPGVLIRRKLLQSRPDYPEIPFRTLIGVSWQDLSTG